MPTVETLTSSKSKPKYRRFKDPTVIHNAQHLVFVNKYQANGFTDPIKAYQEAYPNCKRQSAKISSCRLLTLVSIQAEIRARIEASQVITKDSLSSDLTKYRRWAEEAKDYDSAAEIVFKHAKLLGLITDKIETKTITDGERTEIRRLAIQPIMQPLSDTVADTPSASITNVL